METTAAVKATLNFLKPNPLYKVEKPYGFRYDVQEIERTNIEHAEFDDISIYDMRGHERDFSLNRNGFEVMHLDSALDYDDFYDPEKVKLYLHELEVLLKDRLGASHVKVFRHGLRKRDPGFPVSTGKSYEYDQPTSVAHVDTTPQEAHEEVRRQYGEKANDLLIKRHQWVNVWKPLRGPLNDWPLVLCNTSTVESHNDLEAVDLLYPDLATENYHVYYNSNHRWFYLSDQLPSELLAFMQADSEPGTLPGVPHCSFFNPLTSKDEMPRESIEARALVFYDD